MGLVSFAANEAGISFGDFGFLVYKPVRCDLLRFSICLCTVLNFPSTYLPKITLRTTVVTSGMFWPDAPMDARSSSQRHC